MLINESLFHPIRGSLKKFDLYYYDGLARQDEEIRLTIGKILSKSRQAWPVEVFLFKVIGVRITFGVFFKTSPGAHPFVWKLVFTCLWMKTNFHFKGWAAGPALKKTPKVIWKWPIWKQSRDMVAAKLLKKNSRRRECYRSRKTRTLSHSSFYFGLWMAPLPQGDSLEFDELHIETG